MVSGGEGGGVQERNNKHFDLKRRAFVVLLWKCNTSRLSRVVLVNLVERQYGLIKGRGGRGGGILNMPFRGPAISGNIGISLSLSLSLTAASSDAVGGT